MISRLPFQFAKQHGVITTQHQTHLTVSHRQSVTAETLLELQRQSTLPLSLTEVTDVAFDKLLTQHYESNTGEALAAIDTLTADTDLNAMMAALPQTPDLLDSVDDAPIIRLINAVLTQALKQSASDIHFETFEETLVVRYRIDGVLREVLSPPRALAALITSRLKIMAKLDIAEKRLPQDGRITLRVAGRAIDLRVSTIPTHHGERIVLRILDQQTAALNLTKLGMSATHLKIMDDLIHTPHGIILVTGPTGSGKTTTLYAAITDLNDTSRNILTIEDPIEYYLTGIGQTQVNPKIGMTFAKGLRAILRQDPDVVMVGEIRDLDTAEMTIQASLTGHLVLSTLHTNTAIGAITRLRDMGTEPFLIASTVIGVVAQRLVRVLCDHCKHTAPLTTAEKQCMGLSPDHIGNSCRAKGCEACGHTGYLGRRGIYEIITVDPQLQTLIHDNATEASMLASVRQHTPSIRQAGFATVLAGHTSIEEVLRVTKAD